MITESQREALVGVRRVTFENGMTTVHFLGGATLVFGGEFVSGATSLNIDFAVIAPELFNYEMLNGRLLHITCPYTQPYTGLLGTYVRNVVNGSIDI